MGVSFWQFYCGEVNVGSMVKLETLDFEVIREKFDTLLIALSNKLERECPQRVRVVPGACRFLQGTLKVSANTYHSIIYLCADKPLDPGRKLEYAISIPPLVRTIVDSLCTIVFLFEDFARNTDWFHKSGWREMSETYGKYQKTYGSNPAWKDWLNSYGKMIDRMKHEYGISKTEAQNPQLISWWPNPGKMIKHQSLSKLRKDFLQYINDWFYRELSGASHLSLPGLIMRATYLLEEKEAELNETLNKYRSDNIFTTITILLALVSELECELRFELTERAKYLWTILSEYWGPAKEIYLLRYNSLL